MSLRHPKQETIASPTDLFGWIAAAYTKETPTGTPPTYMMHRFMASDPELAQAARVLQNELREPDLIFRAWQGLLPKMRQAPRFAYVVPKKGPEAEELTLRLMVLLQEGRHNVERMIGLVQLAGRERDLYREVGIQPPGEPVEKVVRKKGSIGPEPGQGLFARRRT